MPSLRTLTKRAAPRAYPRQSAGQSIPIPAPSLGMNTRDGVSSLDPREARSIRNMIAESGRLRIRKGKTEHQTIDGTSTIGSMFTHEGVSANVLLAAAGGEIYDATGAPNALTAASYSQNTWCIAQFNDTTIAVNGADTPWAFNGTAIGATGLSGSGLTLANLRTVHVVDTRIWFTEIQSANVWYLAPDAITGVLTKFNLGQQTKGGYCVGVYAYKSYTVFVMSTGEITAYQGDPGVDFDQVATYGAPRPVGYNPGIDVQGDLVIMTASGALPFESIASGVAFDTTALGTWGKIAPSWSEDFQAYGANAGWNAVFFMGLVIFTLQTDATTSKQWIYNTKTKAWSFLDGLDGYQFAELNGVLYLGDKGSNTIWAYAGGTDDDEAIVATVRHSFTYPFQSQVNGQFSLARINAAATSIVLGQIHVDVDYREQGIFSPQFPLSTLGFGPWDEPWDGVWGEGASALLRWSSVKGFGRAVAPVVQFTSRAEDLQYFATDVVVAPAGIVG